MKLTPGFNLLKVTLYAALAAGISIGTASAQNVIHGKFTLPFEARWGTALLLPGDYTFQLNTAKRPYIVAVRQGEQSVVMAMAQAAEQGDTSGRSALVTVRAGGKYRIWTLRLAEAGLTLDYTPTKPERSVLAEEPVLIQRVPVLTASK
jgi:hypothetical protein